MHYERIDANMEVVKCIVKFPVPKREPDDDVYVEEYEKQNIFKSLIGQMALELINKLVMERRQAIEDFRNGVIDYEFARTPKGKTKCDKSRYLCKIQLRQPEGGIDRGSGQSSA